jgi:hypothetical protein
MGANIRLMPRGSGIEGGLTIPIPADEVVMTTLVVTAEVKELPTLTSVERIVGKLASVGLVLADPSQNDDIARLINKKFLPVRQDNWKDQDLRIRAERADGPGAPEALRAVAALRVPVLSAASTALSAGGAYGQHERRANEIRLVDDMTSAVTRRKSVWVQYAPVAATFIAKTVLDELVKQLIGIPISDLIRSTIKGAGGLIF